MLATPEAQASGALPIIFLPRGPTYADLNGLLDYLHAGTADVPPAVLPGFTRLARDLGVKGFKQQPPHHPATPQKQLSEPASMPGTGHLDSSFAVKRRRLARSLDDDEDSENDTTAVNESIDASYREFATEFAGQR